MTPARPAGKRWWRAYESALDDPKVQNLPGERFKAWFNLLCLACRGGGRLPALADIAFALRKPEREVARILADLEERGLIDRDEAGLQPHNWHGRQYQSDGSSTERAQRFRQRRSNVAGNVACNGDETPSESESESETETETETDSETETDLCVSPGRAVSITERWQPSEAAIARLRKARPDIVGVLYEQRLQEFRLWCRASAITSHDPEATWMGFLLRTHAPRAVDWREERDRKVEAAIERSKRFGA